MTEESGFKAKTLKRKNVKGLALTKPPPTPEAGPVNRYHENRDSIGDQLSTLEIGVELKLDLRAEDLKVVNELGAGNGGTVSKVIHAPTGAIMAKKVRLCFVFLLATFFYSSHRTISNGCGGLALSGMDRRANCMGIGYPHRCKTVGSETDRSRASHHAGVSLPLHCFVLRGVSE